MTLAITCPGQGSQAVGMGKALAQAFAPARAVFDEVDAALGETLTATMWEGPADKLTLTENAQPALMAVSVAVMRVLEAEAGIDLARDARFVAGHSLGEYSALAAAGAFTVTDAAKLLRIRGSAMQKASTTEALERAAPYLRRVLRKRLTLKVIPKIVFTRDDTPERASRIDKLLLRIKEEEGPR